MRCSHNACKFSLALSRRSVNAPWGLLNAREIIEAVLVYKHGFSSKISWNTLGLLKLEQKQGAEALLSGRRWIRVCFGDFAFKRRKFLKWTTVVYSAPLGIVPTIIYMQTCCQPRDLGKGCDWWRNVSDVIPEVKKPEMTNQNIP